MTLNHVPFPRNHGPLFKGLSFNISYAHLMKTLDDFALIFCAPRLSFTLLHFQISHVTLHAYTHICRFTSTLDLNDNNSAIAVYDSKIQSIKPKTKNIVRYLENLPDS